MRLILTFENLCPARADNNLECCIIWLDGFCLTFIDLWYEPCDSGEFSTISLRGRFIRIGFLSSLFSSTTFSISWIVSGFTTLIISRLGLAAKYPSRKLFNSGFSKCFVFLILILDSVMWYDIFGWSSFSGLKWKNRNVYENCLINI